MTSRPARTASVLVPAFNEELGIVASLHRIDAVLAQRPEYAWEIVVVDDGSADATADAALSTRAELRAELVVLRHRVNQGLGGALRTGLARCRGVVVITLDSDLSYAPETALDLLAAWEDWHAHIVIASPYMPGGSTVDVPPQLEKRSRTANRILSAAALDELHTLTGMVRAYDGAFVRSLSLKAVDADINAEIVYKTQLLRGTIIEIPATLNWSGLAERSSRSALLSRRSRWNTAKSLVISYLFRPFLFPLFLIPPLLIGALLAAIFGGFTAEGVFVICLVGVGVLGIASVSMLQAKRYFEELFTAVVRTGRGSDAPGHPVSLLTPPPADD